MNFIQRAFLPEFQGASFMFLMYFSKNQNVQKLKKKKQVLKEEEENGLLSEKNIKPQE